MRSLPFFRYIPRASRLSESRVCKNRWPCDATMHVPRRVDKVRQSEAAPLSLGQQLVLHKQQVSCGYGSYGLSTSPQGVALTVALRGPTGFMATARAVAGEVRRWQIRLLTSLVDRFLTGRIRI